MASSCNRFSLARVLVRLVTHGPHDPRASRAERSKITAERIVSDRTGEPDELRASVQPFGVDLLVDTIVSTITEIPQF
jgi:hypothetical protein